MVVVSDDARIKNKKKKMRKTYSGPIVTKTTKAAMMPMNIP